MSANRDDSFEGDEKLNVNSEPEDSMDISEWNFDPSTLNPLTWNDNNHHSTTNPDISSSRQRGVVVGLGVGGSSNNNRKRKVDLGENSARLESNSWDGNMALLSNFVGLEYEGGGRALSADEEQGRDTMIHSESDDIRRTGTYKTTPRPQETSVARRKNQSSTVSEAAASSIFSTNQGSTQGSGSSTTTSGTSNYSQHTTTLNPSQLNPLGIPSIATTSPPPPAPHGGHHAGTMESGTTALPTDFLAMHGISPEVLASFAASLQNSSTDAAQNLNSLAANFAYAQGTIPPLPQPGGVGVVLESYEGKQEDLGQAQGDRPTTASCTASPTIQASTNPTGVSSVHPTERAPDRPGSTAPPFYLFDAPVELRANFMQNQKRLGLPIHHDPNSYHFGQTVRGFHPQQLMNKQRVDAMAATAADGGGRGGGQPPNHIADWNVQLIDARHGNIRPHTSGTVKNEREQKRAAKITELIERIRQDMEDGGWQVEMRSKFHTLSKCAEYMKHMIQSTEDKEKAINKLRADLEIKRQKIEEDKSAQESRSDPESVTSSLTSDTSGSKKHSRASAQHGTTQEATGKDGNTKRADARKDNMTSSRNSSTVSTNEDSSGGDEGRASGASGSGSGSGEPSAPGFSIEPTAMTGVSDLTCSNQASSSNNSGSVDGSGNTESMSPSNSADSRGGPDPHSAGSISSDAAVASQKSSGDHQSDQHSHNHKDVIVDHGKRSMRKRASEDTPSLKRSRPFGVDYQEVFNLSNVPQLIAMTSGKVVAWNKSFIKVTGIRRSEVERMTIFSLVKPDQLSKFFEMVSKVLKVNEAENEDDEGDSENNAECEPSQATASVVTPSEGKPRYADVTLPCIDFPAMKRRRETESSSASHGRLYVTVTLMTNVEAKKRCFHCVLSNQPRSDGVLGILSPGLLASMYTGNEYSSTRQKRHRRHTATMRSRSQPKGSHDEIPTAIQHNNDMGC